MLLAMLIRKVLEVFVFAYLFDKYVVTIICLDMSLLEKNLGVFVLSNLSDKYVAKIIGVSL